MYKSDGFIYPAVLFVSAAVLLVISYTSSDFITRKTFAKEAGEYWIGENLLQNGVFAVKPPYDTGTKGPNWYTAFSVWHRFFSHHGE